MQGGDQQTVDQQRSGAGGAIVSDCGAVTSGQHDTMPLATSQLQPQPAPQPQPQPRQTAGSAQEPAAVVLTQAHLPRLPTATVRIVTSPAKPAVVPPASLSQPPLQPQPHVQPQSQPHYGLGTPAGHHMPCLGLPEQRVPLGGNASQQQVPSASAPSQPQQAQATCAAGQPDAAEGAAAGAAGAAKTTAKRRQTRLCWPRHRAVSGIANGSK